MKSWVRILGIMLGAVVIGAAALAGYVINASDKVTAQTFDVATHPLTLVSDSASDTATVVARGAHLATVIAKCTECHGADLGGAVVINDPGIGYVAGPNLTTGQGGVIALFSDAELERVIRDGVNRDGHGIAIMPSDDYQTMTDQDVAALIAFIHSVPPVDRTMPPVKLRPLGRTLVAFKQMPLYAANRIDHTQTQLVSNVADTTVEYGQYLANIGGCTGCHGPTLSGGPIPGMPPSTPPASNLTPTGIGQFTDEQVETMLRTGKRPDNSEINSVMPWKATEGMSALEMRATIKYLRTVAPRATGGR